MSEIDMPALPGSPGPSGPLAPPARSGPLESPARPGSLDPPAPQAPSVVDLSADPFADDLTSELAAAAPKPWRNRATYVLAAVALVTGGFLGGVQVQKHLGSTPAGNARANAAAQFAQARGGSGATGAFGRGGGAGAGGTGGSGGTASAGPSSPAGATTQTNSGRVTLVDGTTVYVTLASGDVLTVKTTSSTKISVGSATKVGGLKAGQSVTVTGPTGSNGNVTATSISGG